MPLSKPEKQPTPNNISENEETAPEKLIIQEPVPKNEYRPSTAVKTSTPSIKDAMNAINNPVSSKEKQDPSTPEETELKAGTDAVFESDESNKFTVEDLHRYWELYVDKLKTEEPRMYNVLGSQKPRLINDLTIEVVFLNNAQLIDFKQKIKISLLAGLKESLKNYKLEINEIVQGEEYQPNTKHYTDTDKLKHMIEKNPSLQQLRQEFNLDFE